VTVNSMTFLAGGVAGMAGFTPSLKELAWTVEGESLLFFGA
jgi:hypothetical protein